MVISFNVYEYTSMIIYHFYSEKHFCDLVPYFFGYKTEFFFFRNNPKDLDPSNKTDLDLWDCLGRVKMVL